MNDFIKSLKEMNKNSEIEQEKNYKYFELEAREDTTDGKVYIYNTNN